MKPEEPYFKSDSKSGEILPDSTFLIHYGSQNEEFE